VIKLRREIATRLMPGIVCALAVGLMETLWLQQFVLWVCIFRGIVGSVTIAALIGAAMPNVLG
jgi:Mg/Co/Ni transporter MgtE